MVLVLGKAAVKYLMLGLALVAALGATSFYFSGAAPTAAALSPFCDTVPPSGEWSLPGGDICVCENSVVTVNGDVHLLQGAALVLNNCTLKINSSTSGQYRIFNDEPAPDPINLTLKNNSFIMPGDNNLLFGFYLFDVTVNITDSEIRGAGIYSTFLNSTGVVLRNSNVSLTRATIKGCYNGLVLNSSNNTNIHNSTFSNNANIGLLLSYANNTNVTWATVRDNGGVGIIVNNTANYSVLNSTIQSNTLGGIYANRSTTPTIKSNVIKLNGGDGFRNNLAINSNAYAVWSNTIVNNTGYAVWLNDTTNVGSIMGNYMCMNRNTTYWALGGSAYTTSPAALIMYNIFCINISRPIRGGCTNQDLVTYYVSGNPLSWYAAGATGNTTCNTTIGIDDGTVVLVNSTYRYGAYETVNVTFNGTALGIGDRYHNLTVHCDPYLNIADAASDYIRDTTPPFSSGAGFGGACGNINLGVYWYDGACNVSYVTLSTNETRGYKNYTNGNYSSPQAVEWNESWTNFSWWNESMRSQRIGWLVWANDSAGNWNSSANTTFLAVPCANASTVSGENCGALTLRIYWNDTAFNQSMVLISTNETGVWKNYTDGTYGSPANLTEGSEYTDFSWWNSSMDGKRIGWKVWWNSSMGDFRGSANITFLAQQCSSPAPLGGGGGGGGGAAGAPSDCSSYQGNMTISAILSARTVSCRPQTDFTLFNLTFSSPLEKASKLMLDEMDQPLVQNPTPSVYKFYRLTSINVTDDYLSKAITEFSVPKAWMAKNNVVASAVNLYRLVGKEWEVQPTVPIGESSNVSNFRATLTSIQTDTFAIAAGKACSACPASGGWSDCVDNKRTKTAWTCSVETDYVCQNFTTTGKCACGLCPATTEGACSNGQLNRTVYSCSADTDYNCKGKSEIVSCPPLQLLMPYFSDLASAPLAVQVAVAAGSVAVVGGGGFAAYRFLKLRGKLPGKAKLPAKGPAPKPQAKAKLNSKVAKK